MFKPDGIRPLFEWFETFSWRKFFVLVGLIVLLLFFLSLYERFTSSFRLARLNRTAELIAKMRDLEASVTNCSVTVREDYKELLKQVDEAVKFKPLSLDVIPSRITFSMDGLWKFLAGSAAWVVLAFLGVWDAKRREVKGNLWRAFFGISGFGAISGACSMLCPAIWWPWFHLLLWPFLFTMAFGIFATVFGQFFSKSAGDQKSQNPTKGQGD